MGAFDHAMVLVSFVFALALTAPARWAQWVSGISPLALTVGFTIAFSNTLH